jgi:DNA-binding NarL/FixJ family response regulator
MQSEIQSHVYEHFYGDALGRSAGQLAVLLIAELLAGVPADVAALIRYSRERRHRHTTVVAARRRRLASPRLTRRERAVLEGILAGRSNREIAQNLRQPTRTIEAELAALYQPFWHCHPD